jgi:hypothetical protein
MMILQSATVLLDNQLLKIKLLYKKIKLSEINNKNQDKKTPHRIFLKKLKPLSQLKILYLVLKVIVRFPRLLID